jgi:hypothetical protein
VNKRASRLEKVTAALAANGQRPELPGCAHPIVRLRTEDGRVRWGCRDSKVPVPRRPPDGLALAPKVEQA